MDKNTFIDHVLTKLKFEVRGNLLTKNIEGSHLSVDVTNKTLHYPEDKGLKINERQTCNFSSSENFVVFECVHRLLEKGYQPKHIELEPKWKLGHGASGGRAGILIRDNQGKPLLIIECKTSGREFNKHWKLTLQDGDQLFSYAHQEPSTQFLCLYASDWEDDHLAYQSHVIAIRDNDKYLEDNPSFQGFKDATDQKSRYHIWRDTYKLDFTPYGIFEPAIAPYHIGKDKYSVEDLKPISSKVRDGQYHKFATILRQHNVSGRENAFDKLVNLLLCKLVDETENPDELAFYWKGVAYDTHFELLDRLQQLYQRGMKKFLGEEITYIGEKEVNESLSFIRQNPDATQRAVWNLFIQQKFFTNNDFSLIDVHNEKLFYQNAEILLKILQMWQEYRLIDPENPNQFLGDMFEFFLDQGVKQSEGQFFTPMPICRFLIQSLPLESITTESASQPRAIDYACGAGHFLNELALQLKPIIENQLADSGLKPHEIEQRLADQRSQIFGIEKEYRLSKISKVSAFMYQQPEIQLAYADALMHEVAGYPEIKNNSFDILVANPPYSVKGFLETLPDEERARYQLNETINDPSSANAIETFFIERAAQLLSPGGVAAIILPASIISNGGSTYTRAREILLQSFDIIAIAEFGSGTFGKTGTNTTTLFLRRKQTNPAPSDHYRDRINEWFKGENASKKKAKAYQDSHLIVAYARHCEIEPDDYKTLLTGKPSKALLAHTTFDAYAKDFDNLAATKNLKKQKKFKDLSKPKQAAELQSRLLAYINAIEKDKLLYFLLAHSQETPVLILKSPTGTKERKAFLGYEWSSAKGGEGIKLTTDKDNNHVTPLYDPIQRNHPEKISNAIARNFQSELNEVPESITEHLSLHSLENLLDFSRTSFEKQISLTPRKNFSSTTKWDTRPLAQIAEYSADRVPASDLTHDNYIGVDNLLQNFEGKTKSSHVPTEGKVTGYQKHDILMSNIRPYLKKIWLADIKGGASNDVLVLRVKNKDISPDYLHYTLTQDTFIDFVMAGAKGVKMPRGDKSRILTYPIPVAPPHIQQQIVTECQAVDNEVKETRSIEVNAQTQIDSLLEEISSKGKSRPLKQACSLKAGKFVAADAIADFHMQETYPCYGGNGLRGYTKTFTHEGLFPLVGRQGALCGNVHIVEGKFHATEHALVATPASDVNIKWLAHGLRNLGLGRYATGAAQPGLSVKNLVEIPMSVPPLTEQKKLVAKIEKQEAIIAEAEAIIAAAPAKKSAILKKHLE